MVGSIIVNDGASSGPSIPVRRKLPHVLDLAISIDDLGGEPIAPLVCKRVGRRYVLVAGRDRLAALLDIQAEAGRKLKVPIRVPEGATPEELARIERDENARRRHLTPGEIEKLKPIVIAQLQEAKGGQSPLSEQTIKAETRKLQAAAEGVKPATVKKREQRAKERDEGVVPREKSLGKPARPPLTDENLSAGESPVEQGPQVPHRGNAAPPPPIDTHGHPMPPQLLDIGGLVRQFEKVHKAVHAARAEAMNLGLFASMPVGVIGDIEDVLNGLLARLKAELPRHLCVYCATSPGVKCPACKERLWLTSSQFNAAPEERREGALEPHPGPCGECSDPTCRCYCVECIAARARAGRPAPHDPKPATREGVSVEEHGAGLDPSPPISRGPSDGVGFPKAESAGSTPARDTKKPRGPRVVIVDELGDEHEVDG